jgi:hypothetical protein
MRLIAILNNNANMTDQSSEPMVATINDLLEYREAAYGMDRICILYFYMFKILTTQYEGLTTPSGWVKLYLLLRNRVGLRCFRSGSPSTWKEPANFHQLVAHTTLLFHAITPIRLAIIDGQCRLTSTIHALLGVHPFCHGLTGEDDVVPFQFFDDDTNKILPVGTTPPWSFFRKIQNSVTLRLLVPNVPPEVSPKESKYVLPTSVVSVFQSASDLMQSALENVTKKSVTEWLCDVLRNVHWNDYNLYGGSRKAILNELEKNAWM